MARHQNVLGLTLLAFILAFLNTDLVFAQQLQLERQASQSSTSGDNRPGLAVDNSIATTSITEKQANPWWKVHLDDIYCLKKITLFTRPTDDGDQIEGAVVRAGLSSDHLQNRMIGSPLTLAQAQSGQIEFTLDPTVIARYVSVDIPTSMGETKSLILREVEVDETTQSEDNTMSSALPLSGNPSFQSSTRNGQDASRALDGNRLVFTHTNREQNPWWKVDLVTEYCLGKIRILNLDSSEKIEKRLIGAVVRAGLSDVHTENAVCGSPVTQQQALSGHWIEFTCDLPRLSRFVSVNIPRTEFLSLSGVQVFTCKEIDFTLVTNISLIGQTGDNEAAITAYKGCGELTASVSFGRQLTTGGTNTGLPTASNAVDDPVLDRAARSLILPEAGGIDRVGVFYSKVSKSGRITKMQTILLPKNDGVVILPAQQTLTVNVGELVTLTMVQNSQTSENVRWKHNETAMDRWNNQLTVSIPSVVKSDEGIYSCFVDGKEHQQRHGIMRLIVRACPSGMWGLMCLNECRRCYNGGICGDHTRTCVCAPGFSGDNCEKVHGRHVFGKDAQYGCSDNNDPHHDACQGHLFCLSDPYGCSCAAGYMGLDCMQECSDGMYGADCKQTCHCQGEGTCLKDTGECMEGVGCQSTYFGPNCQCTGVIVDITVNLQIARSDGPSEITLQWDAMTCADYYRVEYSQINKDMCQSVNSSSATVNTHCSCQSTSTTIPDLDSNSVYLVRVEARFGLINGTAATSEVMTRTSEPTAAPTDVLNSAETNTSLSFSWSEPLCGGRGGNITGYTYKLTQVGSVEQYDVSSTMVTTHGLIPYTDYSFQVAASTSEGTGPFSNSFNARTAEGVPPAPMDLKVKNADGSSITVEWTEPDPPHGIIINYDISYWPSTQDEESANITTNVSVTSITYRVEGLMTNVTYFIKVRAKTSAGAGVWSDAVNGITQVGATTKAPSPPTGSGTIVGVLIAVIIIVIIIIVVVIFLKR